MSFDFAKSKNAVAKSKKNNQKKTFGCTHTLAHAKVVYKLCCVCLFLCKTRVNCRFYCSLM